MALRNPKVIRRRIRSVQATQKITKAMKMVAAAKLRRVEGRVKASRPYFEGVERIMRDLSHFASLVQHPLTIEQEQGVTALLLITGDRGLCGSYNSNLIREAERFLLQIPDRDTKFICLGKKGNDYFRKRGGSILTYRLHPGVKITFEEVAEIQKAVVEPFTNHSVREVYVLYAKYVSATRNIPTIKKILPIQRGGEEGKPNGVSQEYLLEPSGEIVLQMAIPRYFQTLLYQLILESASSENGARMVAMDNATRSAGDMIDALTLEYNKARQASITKELADITGTAKALE